MPGPCTAAVAADAFASPRIAPTPATGRVTPRRTSRRLSFALPRAKRLARVPSGMPRQLATSARPSPSSSHSTSGVRNDSGSRASSASSTGAQSGEVVPTSAAATDSGIGTSRDRRLASRPRACIAQRVATPCSHAPKHSGSRRLPAFLASTSQTACAASSASGAFDRTRRQTAVAIGPCRRASSANAPSSRASAKNRTNSASVALPRWAVEVMGGSWRWRGSLPRSAAGSPAISPTSPAPATPPRHA